jgi:PAS domain S-box-containing protein
MTQDSANRPSPQDDLHEIVSEVDTLGERISAAQARMDLLAARSGALPAGEQAAVDELLETFSFTLEELRVAGEELSQQNDELILAYQELESVQQSYRDLFEFAPGGYFVTDREGVIRQANRAAGLLLGISPTELEGRPLVVYIAAGGRADFHRQLNRLLAAENGQGEQVEWETRMATRYGARPEVPVLLNGAVKRDGALEPSGVLWLARDLSALKRAQEALSFAERQALVGRLASSLAHEMGNPLQAALGCIGLAHEALPPEGLPRVRQLLELGRSELRRTAEILNRLRELGRPATPDKREPTDLNALLERVLLLMSKHCEDHHIAVTWSPAPELPPVEATPGRLQQVFVNLVLNAVDAMPNGGVLTLSTEASEFTIRAVITDTGVGIAASELHHLFTPFHTTKEDGMGLGLYVCKQIVDEHKGDIEIRSQAGEGTTFTVTLPVANT